MPKKAKSEEAILTVAKTILKEDPIVKTENIKVRIFGTDVLRVKVAMGSTINMGNYESLRVDVSFDVPCYVEEAKEMFQKVEKFTFKRLDEEIYKLKEAMGVE